MMPVPFSFLDKLSDDNYLHFPGSCVSAFNVIPSNSIQITLYPGRQMNDLVITFNLAKVRLLTDKCLPKLYLQFKSNLSGIANLVIVQYIL